MDLDKRTRAAATYTIVAGLVLLFVLAVTTLRFSQVRSESIAKHGLAEFALVQRDLMLQLVSEESAVRGYGITQNAEQLNMYALAAHEASVDRDVLGNYVLSEPDLTGNLTEFASAFTALQDSFAQQIALTRSGRRADLVDANERESALMQQVRTTDSAIETWLASDRAAMLDMSLKMSDVAVRTSLLLELVVLISLFTFFDVLKSARSAHASANEDALTGIPNRRMALRALQRLAIRSNVETLAVLYLDLDGFKRVNDTHGHASGDAILVEAAKRLKHEVREGDIVARLGGDEFVCIMPGPVDREVAKRIADRIHYRLTRPYQVAREEFILGCSVGWILAPARAKKAEELLSMADRAMYNAKASGGGVHFWPLSAAHTATA